MRPRARTWIGCLALGAAIGCTPPPPVGLDPEMKLRGTPQSIRVTMNGPLVAWVEIDGQRAIPAAARAPSTHDDVTTFPYAFTLTDGLGRTWKAECTIDFSREHSTIAMTTRASTVVSCLFRSDSRAPGLRRVSLIWSSDGLGLDGEKPWNGSVSLTSYATEDGQGEREVGMQVTGSADACNFAASAATRGTPADDGVRASFQTRPQPTGWRAPDLDADRLLAVTLSEAAMLMLQGQPRSP